jgi:hypothetical protein
MDPLQMRKPPRRVVELLRKIQYFCFPHEPILS